MLLGVLTLNALYAMNLWSLIMCFILLVSICVMPHGVT